MQDTKISALMIKERQCKLNHLLPHEKIDTSQKRVFGKNNNLHRRNQRLRLEWTQSKSWKESSRQLKGGRRLIGRLDKEAKDEGISRRKVRYLRLVNIRDWYVSCCCLVYCCLKEEVLSAMELHKRRLLQEIYRSNIQAGFLDIYKMSPWQWIISTCLCRDHDLRFLLLMLVLIGLLCMEMTGRQWLFQLIKLIFL